MDNKQRHPKGYWTLEHCQEDALQYGTRRQWFLSKSSGYAIAHRHGWLETCCLHMPHLERHPMKYWTIELCKAEALKFKSKNTWRNGHSISYSAAYKHQWIEECCTHMDIIFQSWTLEKCKEEALKFTTRTKWQRNGNGYAPALRNGWLEECCQHLKYIKQPNNFWTLERCKKEALKYNTRTEWQNNGSPSYQAAYDKKWIDVCCSHMSKSTNVSIAEQELLDYIKTLFPNAQKKRLSAKGYFDNKEHIQGFDIDVYIPELRKGIEFNGDYWHSEAGLKRSRDEWPQKDIENYHQLKRALALSKNIIYIEIWEKNWKADKQACLNQCVDFLCK